MFMIETWGNFLHHKPADEQTSQFYVQFLYWSLWILLRAHHVLDILQPFIAEHCWYTCVALSYDNTPSAFLRCIHDANEMGVAGDQLFTLCWILVCLAEKNVETVDGNTEFALWPEEDQLWFWSYAE